MNPLPPVLGPPVATRAPGGGVPSLRGPVAPPEGAAASPVGRPSGGPPRPAPRPESLHPALWLAHQVGRVGTAGMPSGFAALDAELPGGGWPFRALTELLLPHPGVGEIRLLGPCIARVLHEQRPVMLFDPPAGLSGAALAALGIDAGQLLIVFTRPRLSRQGPDTSAALSFEGGPPTTARAPGLHGAQSHAEPGGDPLWALEQALRSGHVGGVLAWLPPRLAPARLRRLQLAAQSHDGPAFMLREQAVSNRPSPAPLRLVLQSVGIDGLGVQMPKRRGPPLLRPLVLSLPPVLPASVVARLAARARRRPVEADAPVASASAAADTAALAAASPLLGRAGLIHNF